MRAQLIATSLSMLLLVLLTGCSGPQLVEDRDGLFSQAVEASLQEEPRLAARASHHYLRGGTVDDPRYDRASRILADNLLALGLTYAASLWYLEIASARRDVELAEDAVLGLAHIVENYPHDRWTLVDGFVATDDISGVGGEARAFVDFHQGVHSLRRGRSDWASYYFEKLPASSPYMARARYVLAIDLVARFQLAEAEEALEAILEDFGDRLPRDVNDDIHRTLARLAFEKQDYAEALRRYEAIRTIAPDDPQLLLEMAWTEYYLNNPRRSLGLLLALDAPAYQNLIAPERFLLEALNLQLLCQFEPARTAAVRLGARYGEALEDLRQGVLLKDSASLVSAARLREGSQPIAQFRRRLLQERQLLEEHRSRLGGSLYQELSALYERGLQEVERREGEILAGEMEALATELLGAAEGVRLILHEISVALLRGRDRVESGTGSAIFEVPVGGSEVFYHFTGEFWTDEIDDLIVPLEDRCIE